MNREEPGYTRKPSRWDPLIHADGWALFLAFSASRLYLGVLVSLALIAVLPTVLGWHGTVVQSGSMEPHISAGDVVLATDFDAGQKVPVGGVVEFISPGEAEPGGVEKIRLHRIVAENADGTFVTAGDANAGVDSTPLERGQIIGQARLLVPAVGLPGLWLSNGNLPALAWWSLLTLLAIAVAAFGSRPTEDEKDQEEFDAEPPACAAPPARDHLWRWRTSAALGILAALTALLMAISTGFSASAFTASTGNAANTFGTASDWAPPSVTINDPGTTVRASVSLTAQASDAETGIRSVGIQYLPPGGVWTTLCTLTTEPYSCTWNTPSLPDGAYSLRAVATDNSGLTTTSAPVHTAVANTFAVVLDDPGEVVRGTVILATALTSPGSTAYSVRVEYSVAGANKWNTLCSNLAAPYQCTWATGAATGAFANDSYDLRAVAVSGITSTYSKTITEVLVDNLAPTVTMSDPGTPLRGTITFTAVPADAHSGIAEVQIQSARTGTSIWSTLCTITEPPYSCRFDTSALATASYSLRAIATDEAGNSATSAPVTNRMVDNTVSSVSMEDPGTYLTGKATLTATANSTAGVASVRIQSSPAGTNSWTTRCTVAAAPYSCIWDTHAVTDGVYDFRAVLTDGAGRQTISALVAGRHVDNSPLRGEDIQAANGTGSLGRFDAGDTLKFTYSQPINLASVTPGWSGAALPVTVRLRDGKLLGTGGSVDTVDVQRPGSAMNLGAVNTKGNFAKNNKTITFNATMTATTVTTAGIPQTVVTVTLGASTVGAGSLSTSTTAATMVWTPTSSVTSTSAVACSLTPATETGTLDRDF